MSNQEPSTASLFMDKPLEKKKKKEKKGKHRIERGINSWDSFGADRAPFEELPIDGSSKSLFATNPSPDDPAVSSLIALDEALEPAPLQDVPKGKSPLTSAPPINEVSISETVSRVNSLVSSSGTSEQFQSNLFKILVGPKKDQFIVHSDILSKSPKLDAQCHGNFPEAGSKKIKLPDHDSKIFALLLEYLYRGDYFPFLKEEFDNIRSDDEDVRATQLQREGDLYCMAEYYQLDELQDLAVRKMKMHMPVTFESFLSVSEYVYSNSGTRGAFHDYFKEQIVKTLPLVVHEEWLLDVVAKGGDLARDLFLSGRGRGLPQGKADDDFEDEAAVMVRWEDDI